jgi:hypothetical protein
LSKKSTPPNLISIEELAGMELAGRTIAAIDLGSNSFHMVVARYSHGQLIILDRLREMVRLAAGLDEQGRLERGAIERAIVLLAELLLLRGRAGPNALLTLQFPHGSPAWEANVKNIEMEASVILTLANLYGLRAGAVAW